MDSQSFSETNSVKERELMGLHKCHLVAPTSRNLNGAFVRMPHMYSSKSCKEVSFTRKEVSFIRKLQLTQSLISPTLPLSFVQLLLSRNSLHSRVWFNVFFSMLISMLLQVILALVVYHAYGFFVMLIRPSFVLFHICFWFFFLNNVFKIMRDYLVSHWVDKGDYIVFELGKASTFVSFSNIELLEVDVGKFSSHTMAWLWCGIITR